MPTDSTLHEDVGASLLERDRESVQQLFSIELAGDSPSTRRLRLQIDRIGPHFRTLLVAGEIGVGKELAARALHERGQIGRGEFITCYGAALAEATQDGGVYGPSSPWLPLLKIEHGTIFIDGVENLTQQSQSLLLEVIDRWARSRTRARMIAATSQDLKKLMTAGRFRPDLYHRLATIEISIEPLRQRQQDIPALAECFLRRFALLYDKNIALIDPEAIERLKSHDWPGNVRELENTIRNAVLLSEGEVVGAEHLGGLPRINSSRKSTPSPAPCKIDSLQEVVDKHVLWVLELCEGNKVRAAELLGISRSTLYRMLESLAVTNGRVA